MSHRLFSNIEYIDELGQLYVENLRAMGKNQDWIKLVIYLINCHYSVVLGNYQINTIKYDLILQVLNRFQNLSAATRNRYMDTLNAIFNFGITHEYIESNPMKKWKKLKEKKYEVKLNINDLKKIYNASPDHLKWIIEVELNLGCRPGNSELFNLKWEDVNFENSTIRIKGTKTKLSDRIIPINSSFQIKLLEMKSQSKTEYIIEYKGHKVTDCKTSFATALKKAGISYRVRLYDIRHLFATSLLSTGGDLKSVSEMLGHKDTKMTVDTYYFASMETKLKTVNLLPNISTIL